MNPIRIFPKPYLMRNKIRHYAWGTKNKEAFIPLLMNQEIEPGKPYAELWLGTHANAPSELKINKSYVPLDQIIKKYPVEALGKELSEKYNNSFPFLYFLLFQY